MTQQTLSSTTPTTSEQLNCPSCGHANAGWRSTCEQCRAALDGTPPAEAKRPGCLTAYVILSIAGTLLLSIFLVGMGGFDEILGIGIIVLAMVDLVIAWGLWNLRNWARTAVIVFRSITVLFATVGLFMGNLASIGIIVISAYIIWWFTDNGHLFR